MSRRLLAAVAVAALALGLASCGDGGEGTVTTPPPKIDIGQSDDGGAEPSDSGGAGEVGASPVAAPDIPAPDPADYPGMDQETPEGAEQAFKFFWDTLIAGYQGGDHSHIEKMSTADCRNCELLIGEIRELAERGEFWSKVDTTEVELVSEGGGQDFDTIVTYSFVIPEHTEPASDGGEPEVWQEVTHSSKGGLIWRSGKWEVVDFSASNDKGSES